MVRTSTSASAADRTGAGAVTIQLRPAGRATTGNRLRGDAEPPLGVGGMRARTLLPLVLLVVAACGGTDGSTGQPSEEQTYYCGSYDSIEPGTVLTAPPC